MSNWGLLPGEVAGTVRSRTAIPRKLTAVSAAVAATHPEFAILLDGGVRRGTDVVKALALGARAVLVGRPQLWGLAVAGEAGVAHVLDIYRCEIDRTMGLLGATRLNELGPQCVRALSTDGG